MDLEVTPFVLLVKILTIPIFHAQKIRRMYKVYPVYLWPAKKSRKKCEFKPPQKSFNVINPKLGILYYQLNRFFFTDLLIFQTTKRFIFKCAMLMTDLYNAAELIACAIYHLKSVQVNHSFYYFVTHSPFVKRQTFL